MPNIILFNGNIHIQPPATAIALRDGKIMATGDDETIRNLAKPYTEQIDLSGRLVLAGLTDSHFHFYNWSSKRRRVNLADVTSSDELLQKVSRRIKTTPPFQWIKGYGWNETNLVDEHGPTELDLDHVSPVHPIILWRSDGHIAIVNSLALSRAGITADSPDPPGGVIERDEHGRPTGVIKDNAINLITAQIPPPSDVELEDFMLLGMETLHKFGITGIHDQRIMNGAEGAHALRMYHKLYRQGDLKLRVCTNIYQDYLPHAIALGLHSGFGNDILQFGFVKVFSDGSLGARTAWMHEPYLDGGLGISTMPMPEIAQVVRQARQHGWAVSIHAVGDKANHEILNIFSEFDSIPRQVPIPDRIEHVQILRPDDIPRLAQLGLTASVQPPHVLDDMTLVDKVWGERGKYTYPFRSLLNAGTLLALGSDAPVAKENPWFGIHAAVNRRKPSGYPENGWHPEQNLSVKESIEGYTLAAAKSIGQEKKQGSLDVGKLADVIVVDRDIFNVDPMTLADTQVLLTIFNGEVVYRDM